MKSLKGKVALIIGGASGIGAATVRLFAKKGADMVAFNDTNEKAATDLAMGFGFDDYNACFYGADVRDEDAIRNTIYSIVREYGPLNILVNDPGILFDRDAANMSEEQWNTLADNLLENYEQCAAVAVDFMKWQGRCSIINIGLAAGFGNRERTNYLAANTAIGDLTRTLARRYAEKNIRVNAVAPGYINIQDKAYFSPTNDPRKLSKMPVLREGQAKEVAKLNLFLASDAASYITGQVIHIDGGMSSRG